MSPAGSARLAVSALLLAALASPAGAGDADVVAVEVETRAGAYTFHVTLRHADAGWNHYADAWQVLVPDGRVLATRTLHHPHVDEQPFRRSLAGVSVPGGIDRVTVRARDSVHGFGGATATVELHR